MTTDFDYKEAYITMARAAEQAVRQMELLQQGTAKIMLDLIKAQQKAEELIISQNVELPEADVEADGENDTKE